MRILCRWQVIIYFMKLTITISFVLIFCKCVICQEVGLRQYSFYCEGTTQVDDKYLQERIKSIQRNGTNEWRIEAVIFDDCNVQLYPIVKMEGDTLVVNTYTIEKQELQLSNGDKIIEYSQPEECECAYELRMELQTYKIGPVKINSKNLILTDERYLTFPIEYLIYKGDTTGYADKYGLRQGSHWIERKDGILKTYFKDNKCTGCELFDRKGQIIRKSDDCTTCIENSQKK